MSFFVAVLVLFLQFLTFPTQRAGLIYAALRNHSPCVCVWLKMFDNKCIHAAFRSSSLILHLCCLLILTLNAKQVLKRAYRAILAGMTQQL